MYGDTGFVTSAKLTPSSALVGNEKKNSAIEKDYPHARTASVRQSKAILNNSVTTKIVIQKIFKDIQLVEAVAGCRDKPGVEGVLIVVVIRVVEGQ